MEDYIEELQARQEEKFLLSSGLPKSRWNTPIPPRMIADNKAFFQEYWNSIEDRYEEGDNLVLTSGTREDRMVVVSALAWKIRQTQNKYPRTAFFYKHSTESYHPETGELLTWPFTFQMMDVKGLEELNKERERAMRFDDDGMEESFTEAVLNPDFFILTEVGHEWATTYSAKLIEDLLYSRGDAKLPTIVTLERKVSKVEDKHGNPVYSNVSGILESARFKQAVA